MEYKLPSQQGTPSQMIDVKSLRIGNLLYEAMSYGKELMTVDHLDFERGINTFFCAGEFHYLCGKPEGIPLTEEWLLKVGFSKQIGFYKVVEGVFGKGNSLELGVNDVNKKTYYVYFRNFNVGEQDDFVILRNDLMYLHELQNLYQAITGKEIEFKDIEK